MICWIAAPLTVLPLNPAYAVGPPTMERMFRVNCLVNTARVTVQCLSSSLAHFKPGRQTSWCAR